MKNILILAGFAGLAAAVAIYFVNQSDENDESYYVSDEDVLNFDKRENTGEPIKMEGRGFHAMS